MVPVSYSHKYKRKMCVISHFLPLLNFIRIRLICLFANAICPPLVTLKIHIAATPLHHYNIHIIIHSEFMQDRRATLSMQSVCWSCSVIFVAWFTVLDEQNSARDRSLQPITFSAHLIMRCSGFISAATSDDDRRCDYTFAFDKTFD